MATSAGTIADGGEHQCEHQHPNISSNINCCRNRGCYTDGTEINIVDGGTSATSTTVADADSTQ